MINDVDDALRDLIKEEAIGDADVEVVFDAPTRDWASRRTTPTVDIYLYDIREDTTRRQGNTIAVRREDGKVAGYRVPPRVFRLAYLITAWTQRPVDEHRLLTALLATFLRYEVFPTRVMTETLVAQGFPLGISIAQPPPDNRKVPDVWSSLGGDLKPSLDLVVTLPVDVGLFVEAAAEILKPLSIRPRGYNTFPGLEDETKQGRYPDGFTPPAPAAAAPAAGPDGG